MAKGSHSKEYRREYYLRTLEKSRESRLAYRHKNLEKLREYGKQYDKNNQAAKAAREAFRRAQKLNATPKWLTKQHLDDIKVLYMKRSVLKLLTGIMYHVDHIVPLIHEDMCGLHVPWNLQLLPWNENLSKGNRV